MTTLPLLVVEHEADAGPGRLAPHLGPLDVRRPYAGEALPDDVSAHAGIVVLGGDVCAWDDDLAPWLPATRQLLAGAVAAGRPVLGVCLGAQLLTLALGGRVEPGAAGLEVGLSGIGLLPAAAGDPLFGAVRAATGAPDGWNDGWNDGRVGRGFVAPQYHRDAITRLPPDAELLATGDTYEVQAFRVGDRAWGVQYHPEVTGEDFAAWTESTHTALVALGFDPAGLRRQVSSHAAHLDAVAAAHGGAFREIVDRCGRTLRD